MKVRKKMPQEARNIFQSVFGSNASCEGSTHFLGVVHAVNGGNGFNPKPLKSTLKEEDIQTLQEWIREWKLKLHRPYFETGENPRVKVYRIDTESGIMLVNIIQAGDEPVFGGIIVSKNEYTETMLLKERQQELLRKFM